MANYAYTEHRAFGDVDEIKELVEVMGSLDLHPDREERGRGYYGHRWLGHFVNALMGEIPAGVDCRGEICDYEREDELCMSFTTESAWHAPYEIHELIKERFPSVKILYFTDADDDGVMETNDVDGEVFKIRFGIAREDEDEELFKSEEEMFKWIGDMYGKCVSSVDEAYEAVDELSEELDIWMSLHECYVVSE